MRTIRCCNENWKFTKGDLAGAQGVGYDDSSWRTLDVPHDWSIEEPVDKDSPTGPSGGYAVSGVGWYRKTFTVPANPEDQRVFIEFDGVYQCSDAWLNGNWLGHRPFGYIGFSYDLTPHLTPAGEPNVFAMRVDNSRQPNSRWYSGSGIFRNVRIVSTARIHVAHWGTYVTTPAVTRARATVKIAVSLLNSFAKDKKVTVKTDLVSPTGSVVATACGDIQVRAQVGGRESRGFSGNRATLTQSLVVTRPDLWCCENPHLYRAVTRVFDEGTLCDVYETPFGIRSLRFDKDKGFALNGKFLKLRGVCLHHDCGSLGAACPERAWERRLENLQEIGCNAVRCAHYPYDPMFMDLCDRLGILVMAEAFDVWTRGKLPFDYHLYFNEWHETDLRDFIHRDRNHPSVILWSMGNEIPVHGLAEEKQILQKLVAITRNEDRTRPIVFCTNVGKAANKTGLVECTDVAAYNYMLNYAMKDYYAGDRKKHPSRLVVASETTPFPITEHLTVERHPYVLGEFVWTGIDYLGESGIGMLRNMAFPVRSTWCGLLDLAALRKPSGWFRQSIWTSKPMIYLGAQLPKVLEEDNALIAKKQDHPFIDGLFWGWPNLKESWNWDIPRGTPVHVECYTNLDEVELFLNGTSLGRLRASDFKDRRLCMEVPYGPGELKAVGYRRRQALCEHALRTAAAPRRLRLTPDRPAIRGDGRDLCHILIEVVDEQGHIVPTSSAEIKVDVDGAGKLIGLDSRDPADITFFRASKRKATDGKLLAVVKSNKADGKIEVQASAADLESAVLTIKSNCAKPKD